MNTTALMITAAIALPVTILFSWAWISFRRFDRELRTGFEGIHFDI